jgi:hypothetical protein
MAICWIVSPFLIFDRKCKRVGSGVHGEIARFHRLSLPVTAQRCDRCSHDDCTSEPSIGIAPTLPSLTEASSAEPYRHSQRKSESHTPGQRFEGRICERTFRRSANVPATAINCFITLRRFQPLSMFFRRLCAQWESRVTRVPLRPTRKSRSAPHAPAEHVPHRAFPATLRKLWRDPLRTTRRKRGLIDLESQTSVGHIQRNHVSRVNESEGTTHRGFRAGVQHDSPTPCHSSAHPKCAPCR